MGQDDSIKIGNKDFKAISLSNSLTIYRASCENREDYLFANQLVIRYDSIKHIGYLGSYNYVDNFYCRERIDHSVMEQIKTSLSEKRNVHNRTGILFSMEDKNKEFIAVLFLFKNKKFKKFAKRANEGIIRNYGGEKILMQEFNYHKYAKEFILAKTGNKLSLISVSHSF
jgi:hypothetical protein